jgi:hypothetical protein
MSKKNEMVRVYDFETKKVTSIPARELAPGMIRITLQGLEGEFWVEATKLKRSPPQQFSFGPEYKEVFQFLTETFHDVHPQSVEQWEDGFRRDADPKSEIQIWENIANAFIYFTEGKELTFEERKDIFALVFLAHTNGPEKVLLTYNPKAISIGVAKEVLNELAPGSEIGPE